MDKIIGVLGGSPLSQSRNDDDFSDRLNHRYTTSILIVFAVVASTKQYVGEAIQCWVPQHFSGNHEEYANNYCWVRSSYYLPFDDEIPKEGEELREISYYQWVPIILLAQALLFYLPCMFWRSLNSMSGIDVHNTIESAETLQNTEKSEQRETTLNFMTKQMDRYLTSQTGAKSGWTLSLKHLLSRTLCRCCGRRRGNYLVALYIIIKLLYIANVIGQLFMLNKFLGADFHSFGIDVLVSLVRGEDWTNSPRFPLVTMCNFKVRALGNVHGYTVQCVLPINLFNEKIYLFVWFWMVFVVIVTTISLLGWIISASLRSDRHRFVKKHLTLLGRIKQDSEKRFVPTFVQDYLQNDGVFILKLMRYNTNTITTTEFVCSLWDKWRGGKKKNFKPTTTSNGPPPSIMQKLQSSLLTNHYIWYMSQVHNKENNKWGGGAIRKYCNRRK